MFILGFRKRGFSISGISSIAQMRKGAWQQVLEEYGKVGLYLFVCPPKYCFPYSCMGFQYFVPNPYSTENVAIPYNQ